MDNNSTKPTPISASGALAAPADTAGTINFSADDFTPAQMKQMAEWAVADGHMTKEQAEAALAGQPLENADPLWQPGKPEHYKTSLLEPPADVPDGPKIAEAFDRWTRGWLADAQFSRETGSHLSEEILKAGEAVADMSDAEREVWSRTERVKLQKVFGAEYENKVAAARQLVGELAAKHPGLLLWLEESGAGDSAAVVAAFAHQAEALEHRRRGK